jgi:hypothetical protein
MVYYGRSSKKQDTENCGDILRGSLDPTGYRLPVTQGSQGIPKDVNDGFVYYG